MKFNDMSGIFHFSHNFFFIPENLKNSTDFTKKSGEKFNIPTFPHTAERTPQKENPHQRHLAPPSQNDICVSYLLRTNQLTRKGSVRNLLFEGPSWTGNRVQAPAGCSCKQMVMELVPSLTTGWFLSNDHLALALQNLLPSLHADHEEPFFPSHRVTSHEVCE